MSAVETDSRPSLAKTLMKWLLPLLILAAAVFIFQYLKGSKPVASSKPPQQRLWSVQTQPVAFERHQPELVLYGKVESPAASKLTAAVTAYVEKVAVKEGQTVAKGDLLLQLDPRDAELSLRQQEGNLQSIKAQLDALEVQHRADKAALRIEKELYALAEKSVKRFQNLAKRKVSSEDQLDNAKRAYQQQALSLNNREQAIRSYSARKAQLQAELTRASAAHDAAKLDLDRTSVTAPFAGKIASVDVSVGDRVRSGEILTTLYDPSEIQIRSQIPSKDLAQVRASLAAGQQLQAKTQVDGQTVSLTLARLASSVAAGKAGVDALFDLQQGSFAPETGRTLSLTLALAPQDNTIALPPLALYGIDRVYRVQNGALEAVTVERIGNTQTSAGETRVLVRSQALKPDDQVIITQLPNAISGLPVKIAE